MSDNKDVKPYHAKGSAPGQEAADVVAEVLKHAAEREEAVHKKVVPKGPPKWMLPLTVNLGVLALYFLIAQPEFLVVNPITDPRPTAEQVQSTRNMMYLEINRVQNFVTANGRLPTTLAEANSVASGNFDYSVQGDTSFIIIGTVGEVTIVYDSATDDVMDFAAGLSDRIPG